MYSAAELVDALQRRLRLIRRRDRPPGEFPPGWQAWFDAMRVRAGAVTGAPVQAFVETLLARPLASPPARLAALSRWQAFNAIWRQHWQPPEREERWVRRSAVALTALWHLLLGLALLWLLLLGYLGAPPAPSDRGEDVVQVEYIGTGTPDETGSGPQPPADAAAEPAPSPRPERADGAVPPSAPPSPALEAPTLTPPLPEVAQRDVPEPQLPPTPQPAEQPVAVSEPAPETGTFVLPPVRRAQPTVATPEIAAPTTAIESVDVPEPVQPIRRELPQPSLSVPQVATRTPEVAVREVPAPVRAPRLPTVPAPSLPAPDLTVREPSVRVAEIPTPSQRQAPAASAAGPASAPAAPTPAQAAGALPATAPTRTAAAPGTLRPDGTAGRGARTAQPAGGPTTTRRGDDWSDSPRNRSGGDAGRGGLYDGSGRVRLPDSGGSASSGLPPGTINEEIADLDRAGTWLRRKPTDYEPTRFDKYWIPGETLLAEWVRRGVRSVAVPIPGTSKKLVCVVSVLQLGGSCGLSDPNLNEQPAQARPPPDIPFKPELQDDNGSVRPASGG